jgi:hypothetical protein
MARLGRKGRILKWAGLVLSLIIAAAWAASIPYRWTCVTQKHSGDRSNVYSVWIGHGCLFSIHYFLEERYVESRVEYDPAWPRWGVHIWRFQRAIVQVQLPLWIPFLLVALPTSYLFWRDRRRIPPGRCRKCGYNLTGNVSGVCPECGERT